MADNKSGGADARSRDPMERLRKQPREVVQLLEHVPLFDELNLREKAMVAEMAEVVRCSGGTKVFEAGDEGRYLYCILQGRFELRTTIAGMTHGVREIQAGGVVGLDAVLTQQEYHMMCVALENTAALRFHTHQLHQLLAVGSPAAIKLFVAMRTELGAEIRQATLRVVSLLEATSVMTGKTNSTGIPGVPGVTSPGTPASGIHGILSSMPMPGGNPSSRH